MEAVETKKVGKYIVNIYSDDNPDNPRDWDNLGIMYCYHNRYQLGDDEASKLYSPDDYDNWEEFEKALRKDGHIIVLPLGLYDHSGITMYVGSSHDRWDGGGVGFIAIKAETIRENYGVKRISKKILERVKKCLMAEVDTYDKYLTGEVYGFVIKEIDSCWGFYGIDEAMAEGVSVAEYEIERDRKERQNRVKQWVKNSVPLYARV